MSPASKSKSKVKSLKRQPKEQSKGSVKATQVPSNGGMVPLLSPTTADYDSISINGSCSGDSEDHKEKITCTAPRTETIPGFDNDKKDKNKLKNERKHQRQKERRAQELHERCIGFLTSRKFEALSHQLIAMGFSSDRANMALIANEGRMEESVAWLLLDGEENKQPTAVDLDDKAMPRLILVASYRELRNVSEPLEVPNLCLGSHWDKNLRQCLPVGILASVPSMEMKTSDSVSFGPNLPNIGTGLHSRSLNASGSIIILAVPSSLGLFLVVGFLGFCLFFFAG
ncbi:hypothetical protein HPP92_000769 [Vanilla planifolia]|uniref:UBA domain-containing protein n=1 Tax=Vanilla planifolia TaxID=51239 RepID=A0A835RSR2_VANPL|nr:hypothetical protein HPP92_000769 [Vanilla planifolia]